EIDVTEVHEPEVNRNFLALAWLGTKLVNVARHLEAIPQTSIWMVYGWNGRPSRGREVGAIRCPDVRTTAAKLPQQMRQAWYCSGIDVDIIRGNQRERTHGVPLQRTKIQAGERTE